MWELCVYHHVDKPWTTPYHPEGNGTCERFDRTSHGMLATLGREQREQWPRYLFSLTAIYNSTPHLVTGIPPHYLVFGVEPLMICSRWLGRWLNRMQDGTKRGTGGDYKNRASRYPCK